MTEHSIPCTTAVRIQRSAHRPRINYLARVHLSRLSDPGRILFPEFISCNFLFFWLTNDNIYLIYVRYIIDVMVYQTLFRENFEISIYIILQWTLKNVKNYYYVKISYFASFKYIFIGHVFIIS